MRLVAWGGMVWRAWSVCGENAQGLIVGRCNETMEVIVCLRNTLGDGDVDSFGK